MSYHIQIIPKILHFKQPAGTSRGTYTTRKSWYLVLTCDQQPDGLGMGECAPLPKLSCDDFPDYERRLTAICRQVEKSGAIDFEALRPYPSMLFGLETAFQHFQAGSFALWDTPFSRGEAGIPINGLIWMGNYKQMLQQIEAKMQTGFRCIKLKIGAINFDEELALLKYIRAHFSAKEVELRVDANGAFSPADAMDKLNRLAELDLHSIEQPIRAGQWEEMARLTEHTPLPIALDEELIGCNTQDGKEELLSAIRPQYIILKPSLHGGISGGQEWIREAERQKIGWWITSALESNIGLNAIAQWCATCNNPLPQGLGTGALFTDNVEMPLSIRKDCLWYDPESNSFPSREGAGGVSDSLLLDRNKQKLHLENGTTCSADNIQQLIAELPADTPDIVKDLYHFLSDWFSESPYITVHTSGSTGTPKEFTVRKVQMMQSAILTCSYLHLRKGDNALLCMPLQYIAGKMVVVRSLVAGLNLILRTPSGHPLADVTTPLRFAAMIPLQVYNTLQVPEERERLCRTEILIVGGGAINKELEADIRALPNIVYSTYGMTETLSHIALRRLNGPEASEAYTPFPSVQLSLSPDNTLVINAPMVCDETLVTNDIAQLHPDGTFTILGRKDNIINTGGIKVQIECVEETLRSIISTTFAITAVPDPRLGEAIVLLMEKITERDGLVATLASGNSRPSQMEIIGILPPYQRPRYILEVDAIPLTGSGKTDRKACRLLAEKLI